MSPSSTGRQASRAKERLIITVQPVTTFWTSSWGRDSPMAVQAGIVLERGVHLPQLAVHHPQVRVDQHRQGRVRLHLLHEPEGQAHLVRVPHVVLVTEHDVIRLIAKLLQQVHKVLLGAAEPAAGTVMGNPIRIPVGVFLQNGGGILSVVRQDQLPAPYILGQDGIHHGRMNRPPL